MNRNNTIKGLIESCIDSSDVNIEKAELIDTYDEIKSEVEKEREEYKQISKQIEQLNQRLIEIKNRIAKFDYKYKKAKRENDEDRADYYWDLFRHFKKILEGEE